MFPSHGLPLLHFWCVLLSALSRENLTLCNSCTHSHKYKTALLCAPANTTVINTSHWESKSVHQQGSCLPTKLWWVANSLIRSQVTRHEHFDLELAPWPTPPLYPIGHGYQEFSKLKLWQPVLARQSVAPLLVLPYISWFQRFPTFINFKFQPYGTHGGMHVSTTGVSPK